MVGYNTELLESIQVLGTPAKSTQKRMLVPIYLYKKSNFFFPRYFPNILSR